MTHQTIHHPLHAAIIRFYDLRAPTYDSEPAAFHPTLARDLCRWADEALSPSLKPPSMRPMKVLDLCCGTGLVAFEALERFGERRGSDQGQRAVDSSRECVVHGVDISPVSLRTAKAKAEALGLGLGKQLGKGRSESVEFWEGSATRLGDVEGLRESEGQVKGTYSLIICCSAFVFLPGDRNRVLRDWAEYLCPGGVIVFDIPAPETQVVSLFLSRAVQRYDVPVVERDWIQSDESLKEIIEGAGLECVNVFDSPTYIVREHGKDKAEAAWEKMLANGLSDLSGLKHEEKEAAKKAFMNMMKNQAGTDGVVRDEYRLSVGIARKRI